MRSVRDREALGAIPWARKERLAPEETWAVGHVLQSRP